MMPGDEDMMMARPQGPATKRPAKRRRPTLPQEAGSGDVTPPPGAPGMKKGGSVSSASKRADGCAQRGKTKGKFV